jgi:hypothetical protein
LAGEIFLDIAEASHQNNPRDGEKAADEADHDHQDDGKRLPTQGRLKSQRRSSKWSQDRL